MGAGCLLIGLNPNVPEFNVLFCLALKADDAFDVLRIVSVKNGLTIQLDQKMAAFGGDVKLVPLVRLDLRGLRLNGPDEAAGEITGGLHIPNLEFVAGDMGLACFLGAEEDAAIDGGGAAEFKLKLEVLVSGIGGEPTGRRAAAKDRAVFDLPIAGSGRGEGGAGFPAVKGFAVKKCFPSLGVHFPRDGR